MLERLTAQQESRLAHYRDKWLDIGLSTGDGTVDIAALRPLIADVYRAGGKEPPGRLIQLASPFHGAIGAALLAQVEARVGAQVGDQVWAQVWHNVATQVWSNVAAQVWAQVWHNVATQVWNNVVDQVWAQVGDQVRDQVRDQVYRCGYGTHDANWLAFYQFFLSECGLACCAPLEPLMRLSLASGWWWPFENACIVTPRPTALYRNAEHQLHHEGGPAISYGDAWHIHALNGVRVPEWIVVSSPEQMDPTRITELGNAEVRREFVRRVGMERLWHKLSPTILDTESFPVGGEYTLADLNVGSDRPWRVLKMQNPSLPEVWHVEGVDPQCNTVRDALNFRNGLSESQIDDEHGADWYQQGDVILRPSSAEKFKRLPVILT
jgi:hypothetical protein